MVGSARIRGSRGGGEFLHPYTDWFERPQFVLFTAEAVRVGPVSGVDRLLESDREVLIEVAFLRSVLADEGLPTPPSSRRREAQQNMYQDTL